MHGTSPPDNQPEPVYGQNKAAASAFSNGGLLTSSEGLQSEEVYQSVNASQSTMQLYYGPSSNFAFLQHIHQTLTHAGSRSTESLDRDDIQGLDYFKQRETFFGTTQSHALDTVMAKAGSLFLSFELSREFLENFLSSIHHLTPFLSADVLRQMLIRLHGQNNDESLTPAKTVIMLLALANGATLTSHSQWVEVLYEKAKSEAAPLDETVNLEAVQISLLLAHYQASCGRPNSAYLQLGLACRKAYAAGLHKDIEHKTDRPETGERSMKRRVTLWALVFWERWVSFWLGRPSSVISKCHLDAPLDPQALGTGSGRTLQHHCAVSMRHL